MAKETSIDLKGLTLKEAIQLTLDVLNTLPIEDDVEYWDIKRWLNSEINPPIVVDYSKIRNVKIKYEQRLIENG